MTQAILLLLASVLLSVGCSRETSPVSPSPASAVISGAGTWVGSVSDPVAGEGGARLALSEQTGPTGTAAPGALVGTWAFTFRSGETCSGVAEGHLVTGNNFGLFLYLEPSPSCLIPDSPFPQFVLTNAVLTPNRLNAILYRPTGAALRLGSVNLAKQ